MNNTIRKAEPNEFWQNAGKFLAEHLDGDKFQERLLSYCEDMNFSREETDYFGMLVLDHLRLSLSVARIKWGLKALETSRSTQAQGS